MAKQITIPYITPFLLAARKVKERMKRKMENVEPLIKHPTNFEERFALDQQVESHIEREVEYIVNQYRQHIAKFDKDWFIVLTHPKSLCLIYDSESRWKCKYPDITKEIQDRADKIMRDMGYEGFKGYNLK